MSAKDVVRIGGFSAFWGDTPTAAAQLIESGEHLDYIIGDYLAEVTMCILARAKQKGRKNAGEGGYVAEFVSALWEPLMDPIMKRGIKVVTNAGGMNPLALKAAIEESCRKAGVEPPVVAAVFGDDLTANVATLESGGDLQPFSVSGAAEALWPAGTVVMSANAYLGARPIAEALQRGAQIVVTGRVVDSALVLGPLMYEFGWEDAQYDVLAGGSLAGHIIECGAQCCGGNFTDWRDSCTRGWANIGFPIAECHSDGSFVVTKPQGTGGLVSFGTVSEQMLYEILDPAAYELPDVCCDWRHVTITEVGMDRVEVRGAVGRPPSPFYKVAVTSFGGFKTEAQLLIPGFDAQEKALAVTAAVLERCSIRFAAMGLGAFLATNVETLGAEHTYGPRATHSQTREVILRIAVKHESQKACEVFGMELASFATGSAPGITGSGSGRPSGTPAICYYSCLIKREKVPALVSVGSSEPLIMEPSEPLPRSSFPLAPLARPTSTLLPAGPLVHLPLVNVPLLAVAYARSGDKGDTANVGLIARSPAFYGLLRETVTEAAVARHFSHLLEANSSVTRYELPGAAAFNFVLTHALGGGGVSSLRIDRQGKTYGQNLLSMNVLVPLEWVAHTQWGRAVARL